MVYVPPVQDKLIHKLTTYLTEGTGYETRIDYIRINWFNSLTMEDVVIQDLSNQGMVKVEELVLSFDLFELINKKDISTNEVWLKGADVNLRNTAEGSLNIDNWAFRIGQLSSGSAASNAAAGAFQINKISLKDSKFSLSDSRRDSIAEGFDYNHFRLLNINADLLNLKVVADTFQIDVKHLSLQDSASDFRIDDLKTFFRNSGKGMFFYDLNLQMGQTQIGDYLEFRHDSPSQMSYFNDSIDITANFDQTILNTTELELFVPEFKGMNQEVRVDGLFKGRVNSFYSDDFTLAIGNRTTLAGNLDIEGLPDVEKTFFSLQLKKSTVHAEDINQYIVPRFQSIAKKFGTVKMNARLDGLLDNFVADGQFITDIGNISSNVKVEFPNNNLPKYDGELEVKNFDLGYFSGDTTFQKIDMQGTIEGEGFQLDNANFRLIANVPRIGIRQYEYTNIETDGAFAQSFFSGELSVNDPNLKFFANGSIDLRNNNEIVKVNGVLDTAILYNLKLTEEYVMLSSKLDMDIEGLQIDSIQGRAILSDSHIQYEDKNLIIESLEFTSERKTNNERDLQMKSSLVDFEMRGRFDFASLSRELVVIAEQYRLNFSSRVEELNSYIGDNPLVKDHFDVSYAFNLHDITPVIHLFDTTIQVSKKSKIKGVFSNFQQEETFILNAQFDTLNLRESQFIRNEIDINGADLRDTSNVLILGYVFSDEQKYGNETQTENMTFEAVWDGTHIDFRQNISQKSSGNYAEIGASLNFLPNRTELVFDNSNILAIGENWQITDDNLVVFSQDRIDVQNLSIFNATQSIQFDGQVAILQDSNQTLSLKFQNIAMSNVNPLTQESYTGTLNGEINVQNLYFTPILFGNISLTDLEINNFLVGDLNGEINWLNASEQFVLDFTVNRKGQRIISLNGDWFPNRQQEQLDLDLHLDRANLNIAEPYIDDYFSELDGYIFGDYTIKGNMKTPHFTGSGTFKEAAIKVNYLNTKYGFEGRTLFKRDTIELQDLVFKDVNAQESLFSGRVLHDAFQNFRFGLNGSLSSFQVLNTDVDSEEQFYGQAYASGTVALRGESSNLSVVADVTTEANSKLYIPLSEEGEKDITPEFITFIDRTLSIEEKENQIVADEVNKIQITGFSLDLNVEVTPDAYVEIIIDPKTGDIIRGRSEGQLRLQVNQQGNFEMNGEISITEGAYNFSLYNLITKEFKIVEPSTVTWFGNPYEGVMQINGVYEQNTSIAPILTDAGFGAVDDNGNTQGMNRRFPTKVLLNLEGPLLSPEINFDIDLSTINSQDFQITTAISAFKNRIQTNEQELNRQVLSLIVLNRFSEQGVINIGGRSASQNVSQLLSNQLGQLVAQLDDNLEVDFDLADLSEDALNTFRLRLSYTFLDGRLRVTREGGLTNLVDVNDVAGDWTAEYLLTKDGRYKVKVYSRTNFDLANLALNQNSGNTTTGASIIQTTSFNTLKEFFSGIKNRAREKEEEADNNDEENPF